MSNETNADKYKRERDNDQAEITRLTNIIHKFIVDANERDAQIVEMAGKISILNELVETCNLLIKNQDKIMTNIRHRLAGVPKNLTIHKEDDQ